MDNINELIEHCSKSFATKYRICDIYRQMRGPSGHPSTNCMTNAGLVFSRNSLVLSRNIEGMVDLVVHCSHLVQPFFGGGGGQFVVVGNLYGAWVEPIQASIGRVSMGGGRCSIVGKFGKM